jgi:hypothetical protein
MMSQYLKGRCIAAVKKLQQFQPVRTGGSVTTVSLGKKDDHPVIFPKQNIRDQLHTFEMKTIRQVSSLIPRDQLVAHLTAGERDQMDQRHANFS